MTLKYRMMSFKSMTPFANSSKWVNSDMYFRNGPRVEPAKSAAQPITQKKSSSMMVMKPATI